MTLNRLRLYYSGAFMDVSNPFTPAKLLLSANCSLHIIDNVCDLCTATADASMLVSDGNEGWIIDKRLLNFCDHDTFTHLTQIRLYLGKEAFGQHPEDTGSFRLHKIALGNFYTPALEVLELDMHCSLKVTIGKVKVKRLVLIAAGSLDLFLHIPHPDDGCTLASAGIQNMYLQAGAALTHNLREWFEDEMCQAVHLQEVSGRARRSWTAQMPAGFQPGSIFQCCCGTCLVPRLPFQEPNRLACSVQAGMDPTGFPELLEPLCVPSNAGDA